MVARRRAMAAAHARACVIAVSSSGDVSEAIDPRDAAAKAAGAPSRLDPRAGWPSERFPELPPLVLVWLSSGLEGGPRITARATRTARSWTFHLSKRFRKSLEARRGKGVAL